MKKNKFKVVAEAMATGRLAKVKIPTVKAERKLTKEELKRVMKEEMGKIKDIEDVDADVLPWSDVEIENQIDFIKALNIKEFFDPKNKK